MSVYVSRVATGIDDSRGYPKGSPASSTAIPSARGETRSSSRAFAARYAFRVPCSSRCSVVIRVNTAARKATSSARCISSPCDEVSSATCVQPRSRTRASSACNSGASGVVCREGFVVTPSGVRRSTVVIDAAAIPAALHACQSKVAVVVLPSVPVIPATHRCALGCSENASASAESASRLSGTRTTGTDASTGGSGTRSATTAIAPRATASRQKRWPSERNPVMATKRLPGVTACESKSIAVMLTGARASATPGSMPASASRSNSGRADLA